MTTDAGPSASVLYRNARRLGLTPTQARRLAEAYFCIPPEIKCLITSK